MGKPTKRKHESLFLYVTMAARVLYAQRWKDTQILTTEEWVMKLMELAEMAKLSTWMKDNSFSRFIFTGRLC